MSDLHEVVFRWPYNASEAIVTGTFDKWSRSVRLSRGPTGFTATVQVPWGTKVLYKYIVDGEWTTIDQAPTEADWRGNINNIYYAPTKPKEVVTPRNDPPAAREPKIAPVPAPVPVEEKKPVSTPTPQPTEQSSVKVPAKPEELVKDRTPVVDKKEPVPVVPVNGTKPVDTPPAKTKEVSAPDNVPAVLPTPANLKAPLVFVPVNDPGAADKKTPVVEPLKHTDTPSTHSLPINSPRKASTGTSSSNTLLSEKKEEERRQPRPEDVTPNGTGNGVANGEPAKQPPSTPVKSKTPTIPTTPASPSTLYSPPTTPKKPHFPGSASSSPPSSPGNTLSRKSSFKKKRDSFISKVKHLFTPEKDKEKKEHRSEKSHG